MYSSSRNVISISNMIFTNMISYKDLLKQFIFVTNVINKIFSGNIQLFNL